MAVVVCPPSADLERLFLGGLSAEDADALEQHVLECDACLQKLKKLIAAKDTLGDALREETRSEASEHVPAVADLIRNLESLRGPPSHFSKGNPMLTFACSGCQKKLSVSENSAGKKAKCPACGAVLLVPAAVAVGGKDPLPLPSAAPGAGQSQTADLNTNPSASMPDPTFDNIPHAEVDTSLTDFLAPPQSADELGRLGAYRIVKILGHGGMGVVFLGEDITLNRKVAIKAMLPQLAKNKASQQRFVREARTAATLEHDHIVPIFQVGEDRGAPFIVMPLLKGEPLDERLKREPMLPLSEVLRIGRETAEGLAAAHANGLIHRDIKPANIWLEARDEARGARDEKNASLALRPSSLAPRVKILDFGLARAASEESGLTQQGAIIGTPAYMSPEQGRGAAVDARTDLFSLGVLLYRMSTGQMPFAGADTVSTLMAVAMHEPPAPVMVNFELPQELSDLVMKLLEKDPAKRIATAGEVIAAIQGIELNLARAKSTAKKTDAFETPGEPSPVRGRLSAPTTGPSRGSARRKLAFAIALLTGLFIAAAGLYGIIRITTPEGDYVINTDDPDFTFAVSKGTVILNNKKTKREYKLNVVKQKGGEFELEVTDPGNDLAFNTKTFSIKRGETVALKAWFERKSDAVAIAPPTKVGDDPVVMALAFDTEHGKSGVDCGTLKLGNDDPFTLEAYITQTEGSRRSMFPLYADGRVNLICGDRWGLKIFGSDPDLVGPEVVVNRRTHVAGVSTGKQMRLFVDGKLVQSRDFGPREKMGEANVGFGWGFTGTLSEIRFSAAARYDKDFQPQSRLERDRDTIALYHCDEGAGVVLKDSSGGAHHAKIIRAKWVKADATDAMKKATPYVGGDPDRNVAEWVLSLGGMVSVISDDKYQGGIANVKDLPTEPFKLSAVLSENSDRLTVAGLEHLKQASNLTTLWLSHTYLGINDLEKIRNLKILDHLILSGNKLTDAGLEHLNTLTNLRELDLSVNPGIGGAGLAHLKDLHKLEKLDLHSTGVSDAGLGHVKALKQLKVLDLKKTKVTADGVKTLSIALPGCKIESDHGTFEPKAAEEGRQQPRGGFQARNPPFGGIEIGMRGPDNLIGKPLSDIERYYIEKTLEQTGGNREEETSKNARKMAFFGSLAHETGGQGDGLFATDSAFGEAVRVQ